LHNDRHPWALYLGHMLECFDNTLYGFFAVILATVFFPSSSTELAVVESLGAFATGFVARPFGALFFGWMGDRFGRRTPLYWSLLFVGIPTVGIGLTPTHDRIGIFAPVLLLFFRFAQGFLWGGEFAGANIYIAENKNKQKLGTKVSTLTFMGAYGAVGACLMGAVFVGGHMPSWGWRVPFLLGGVCTLFVFLYRRKIIETADFMEEKSTHSMTPIAELIQFYKFPILLTILLTGMDMMPCYFACVYGNTFFGELGLSASQSMLLNGGTFALVGILILFSGRLADRIGARKQLIIGLILLMFFSIPFFSLIAGQDVPMWKIFLFAMGLPAIWALLNGVYLLYAVPLFPVHCRYSGIALGVTLGQALFAGTAPLVGKVLAQQFSTRLAPGFWLSSIALIALVLILTKKYCQKPSLEK
jgi:MHS family proline/betaine transporter-like MFS transporter